MLHERVIGQDEAVQAVADAVLRARGERLAAWTFAHGTEHELPGGLTVVDSYHCSRYNTQTRRLTTAMFEQVFSRARALLA